MKTIKEWLETLESPYREQALENMNKDIVYSGNEETDTMYSALNGAFVWEHTKEGFNYWYKFTNSLYLHIRLG